MALYYKRSKVLKYGPCVTMGSHSTCHTHTRTIRKASPPFGCYTLRQSTKGWPGWVDLGGWFIPR